MRRKWNIKAKVQRLFIHKKYKDELFRRIFNNRKSLLELYNAINETEYTEEEYLIIYAMEDVIYLGYKNDVSFIISGMLNLYEHQSTMNPNMPLRGLIYFSKQYETYIAQNNLNIYGERRVKIPFPQYIIFYNGKKELENGEDTAVVSCINDGILAEFLLKHRAVVGMLFEEFDMKEYIKMERRDSFLDGKAEALLEILGDRGQVLDSLRERILSEQNIEVINRWIKISITTSSVKEFEEKM